MQRDKILSLAQARLQRAEELINEAEILLKNDSYKSANNRAYYSIEKSLTALLLTENVQTQTHNGCLKQFNLLFVRGENNYFSTIDYQLAAKSIFFKVDKYIKGLK